MTNVDVVMVPRERYAPTLESLRGVLDTIPQDSRVILVRGGMPEPVEKQAVDLDPGRIDVVGPRRHLAPNAARAIGLQHTTARYVIFIDNDVLPDAGWVEPLVATAEQEDAWVVRPVVLQRVGDRVTIHETGGHCHLEQRGSVTTLVETHRHAGGPPEEIASLRREQVELFEFHTALFDRDRLVHLGGPDERMRSQGDHLDLALRVRAAGGSIWLEPASVVTYTIPQSIGLRDLSFFLGRWSHSWTASSRRDFCSTHGIDDPDDPCDTWRYPDVHRAYAWVPIGRVASTLLRRPTPMYAARRFDRLVGRRLAEAALRADPRWKHGGLQAER